MIADPGPRWSCSVTGAHRTRRYCMPSQLPERNRAELTYGRILPISTGWVWKPQPGRSGTARVLADQLDTTSRHLHHVMLVYRESARPVGVETGRDGDLSPLTGATSSRSVISRKTDSAHDDCNKGSLQRGRQLISLAAGPKSDEFSDRQRSPTAGHEDPRTRAVPDWALRLQPESIARAEQRAIFEMPLECGENHLTRRGNPRREG